MEQLLASYLYQYKICPLPKVGSLVLQPGNAVAQQADKLMRPPVQSIDFSTNETAADGLLQYISAVLKIDHTAATLTLDNFCKNLLQLQKGAEVTFANAGSFKPGENGQLYFETAKPAADFLPAITAERVIHPDAKHNMLVGDTHTNTGAMTEMLFAEEKPRRASWIWWAAGLAAAAAIVIALYLANHTSAGLGNGNAINPQKEPASTYSTGLK